MTSTAPAQAPSALHDRLAWGFVLLGIVACFLRYALRFPLWPDESFLALNIARRDVLGLLEPLDLHQVAPPLWLLATGLINSALGFGEWTLRLLPCLAAAGSLLVFRSLARRLLTGWSFVLAVGILSSSYWVVRYGAEAKPYTMDLLLGAALSWLAVAWCTAARRGRSTLALGAVAAMAFGWSFPSVFVGGGVVLFMAATAWSERRWRPLLQAGVVGIALLAGFAAAYHLHAQHQMSSEVEWMRTYWQRAFPPKDSILGVITWLLGHAAGEMMPYPVGGRNAGSVLTLLLVVVGTAMLARSSSRRALVLLAAPIALGLVAAALERYPFGAPTRCQLHLAPAFCLLAGAGLARLLRPGGRETNGPRVACVVLALIMLASMSRDVVAPYKGTTDRCYRDLARLLWARPEAVEVPVLSLHEDLGATFSPKLDRRQNNLATFLCNYYVYGKPGSVPIDPAAWPSGVNVVTCRPWRKFDADRRLAWIAGFEAEHGMRYDGSMLIEIPDLDRHGRERNVDVVEIMRFAPPGRQIAADGRLVEHVGHGTR